MKIFLNEHSVFGYFLFLPLFPLLMISKILMCLMIQDKSLFEIYLQHRGGRQGQYGHLFCVSFCSTVSLHIKMLLKHNLFVMDSFWKFWHQHSWISDKQEDLEKYKLGYCNVFDWKYVSYQWQMNYLCVWRRRRWVL